ncbi:MAG: aldehyde ferredoxin oxidoreductase, partial [Actinobacteria bacterium]|nr:aldehyde ferredoxin oxidoreductase [Actinomycetota bacterium]
ALRALGLDFLMVTGACSEPTVLVIGGSAGGGRALGQDAAPWSSGDRTGMQVPLVSVLPAGDLWGRDVPDALTALETRRSGRRAAVIGPAGERGVLFATIANERGRQLGRGGLGAVMGAKRLKAVVIEAGDDAHPVPPGEPLATLNAEALRRLGEHPTTSYLLPEFGTSVLMGLLNDAGVLPTRNFRDARFEAAEAIGGEALQRTFGGGHSSCPGCPVGCGRRISSAGRAVRGPEYESLWALGAACGVGDLRAIVQANEVCNRAGLDTITMGTTIACAMELSETGVLASGPRFGDTAAMLELIALTAARRGLGGELALGSARFAALHGAPESAMAVKGLELPGFDPRGMTGQGLAFATSNRGACHQRASMVGPEIVGAPIWLDRFATLGKSALLIELQDRNAVLDSLGSCKFTACALSDDYLAALLSAVWGETVDPAEMSRAGARIWHLEKLFNLAAGFTRADDTLPRRLLEEPLREGPSAGHVVDLQPMLNEYYRCRDWDSEGRPSRPALDRLGLADEVAC